MERLYPGLARPLFTKGSFPHNGDLADKFLLVEVGDARLNSKEEAVRSAGLLADELAMLLYYEIRELKSPLFLIIGSGGILCKNCWRSWS